MKSYLLLASLFCHAASAAIPSSRPDSVWKVHSGVCTQDEIEVKEKLLEFSGLHYITKSQREEKDLLKHLRKAHNFEGNICVSDYPALLELVSEAHADEEDYNVLFALFDKLLKEYVNRFEILKEEKISRIASHSEHADFEIVKNHFIVKYRPRLFAKGNFKEVWTRFAIDRDAENKFHIRPYVAYTPRRNIPNWREEWQKEINKEMGIYNSTSEYREQNPNSGPRGIGTAILSSDGMTIYRERADETLEYTHKTIANNTEILDHHFEDILAGLKFLHEELKIAQGDVKEGNVLVSRSGDATLIDFGLSKKSGDKCTIQGTPGYIAPELLNLVGTGISEMDCDVLKTDIYSLGLIALHFYGPLFVKVENACDLSHPWVLNDLRCGPLAVGNRTQYTRCVKECSTQLYQAVSKNKAIVCGYEPKSFWCKMASIAEAGLRPDPNSRANIAEIQDIYNSFN